ncbi:TonB-dependent receptor [Dyadobacter luteus]|uniref:TonB-dependent receptor n=1 Tax=Dyadobacter luteus TaxID=2259619 RepID=A0A3D8YAH0_9BACT|nr:TonB-dependent receptor [Dyadobacter luteus]REA60157.1 TonB-dependent receptor [Dyadobacter luteus]
MKKAFGLVLLLLVGSVAMAQHTLTAIIRDADSNQPLPGATAKISKTAIGATADEKGTVTLTGIPAGSQQVVFSFVGYEDHQQNITFPTAGDTLIVNLEAGDEELEEVIISSTRSSRTIQSIPTRVEFIGGEELEEKGNMKPGDIRMMLNESTGIQTQQVSATSANSSIRIQGLDGRYTQILKDGFPLYAGFSGGLGLLQTPPLDLKQVEVIKGASSTLYGGGAIAGLVNLVSKAPAEERELRFLINGTSAGGLDLNGFYSQKFEKVGLTIFASRNSSRPYDPSDEGFTAIPKTERYVFNPKLFLYFSDRTRLNVGLNTVFEDRVGGDIKYIKDEGDAVHSYFEKNKSSRFSTQLSFEHDFSEQNRLTIKNSVNSFDRKISIPGYIFDGKQLSTYSEVAFNSNHEKSDWVAGVNLYSDQFRESPTDNFVKRDYTQNTLGAFVQNTWQTAPWLKIETGLRGDYVLDYGFVLLPRISGLFKITSELSSRLGGGLGYKTPTIFTEETERRQFRQVLPIGPDDNKLEKSYGVNFDINYATHFGDLSFSLNHMFFYTRINNPLLLEASREPGVSRLLNANGFVDTKGTETNLKLGYGDFKLFVGYTLTDAQLNENGGRRVNPLTAKHRLNNVLMYEVEDKWKIGLEAYYYSKQTLSDGTVGKSYWITGFMAERIWEKFSLFINFENFTDTRQTRFGSIYNGTVTNPVFKDIYAPLDGFVINGGIKLNL